MAEVGTYYITIMPEMSKFTSSVKKAMGDAGASGGSSFGSSFADIVKGSAIGTALGSLATKAGSSIMSGLRAGIGRIDTIQNFPKVMQSLGYSTDEASKSIRTIMDHLDGLPTSTDEMVQLTQSIADSTGDLDLATKAALGFNDMLLATGTSTADAASATAILNRVLGKGSATTAQWQSLQQHIPAQMSAIAKKMLGAKATTNDLHEALENGKVSWNDFLQAIVDLDEQGEGAMASFHDQAIAMTGGIGTALENVPNRIARGWESIIDAIGREDIAQTINNVSYGIRDAMVRVGDAIKDVKERLSETKAFENLQTIMETLQGRFGDLGTAIDTAISGATPIIADFIDRALQWIVDHGEQIGNLFDGISSALGKVGDAIGGALSQAGDVLGDLIADGLQFVLDNGDSISDLLDGWATAFSNVADVLSDAFAAAAPVLADCISDSLQWILDHGDGVSAALAGIATALGAIAAYNTAVAVLGGVSTALEVMSMVSLSGGLLAFIGDLGAGLLLVSESGGILAPVLGALGTALSFLAANPFVLIIAAIAAVVGGLVYWLTCTEEGKQVWEDFTTFLSETWEGLKADWESFVGIVQQGFEDQQVQWETFKTNLATWNEEMRENLLTKWEEIKSGVAEKAQSLADDVKQRWDGWAKDTAVWNETVRQDLLGKWEEIKKGVSEKASSLADDVKQRWEGWVRDSAEWNESIRADAMEKWKALGDGIVEKFDWVRERVGEAVDWLKGAFDFEWKLPDIKLPHFNVTEGGGMFGLPSISVDWYAKGGVFNSAALIGIGEAGKEAALPLNDSTYREIASGIASQGGAGGGVVIRDCTFNVREDDDIDRIADALSARWMRDLGAMA